MSQRQTLLNCLGAVVEAAPPQLQGALAQALEDYAYTMSNSYRAATRGKTVGLLGHILETIEEASDARINRDDLGRPTAA